MNDYVTLPADIGTDPRVPDWRALELAPTWADELCWSTPRGVWRFVRSLFGKRGRVEVDQAAPLFANIPRYALQEFHNLPNGNYSNKIARGYITGFEHAMLGMMQRERKRLAERVSHCQAVLDLGTGGGKLAAAVQAAGVPDVWGVDVSPYLLKHAANDHAGVKFIQSPAENLPFAAGRFDAVVMCFLFHEMPPKYVQQALAQCHRVLKPGGQLLILEPSENQLQPLRLGSFFKAAGWRHWYFKTLARFVHEPFVMAWHRQDKPALFEAAGFSLTEHRDEIPVNFYALEKSGC